MFEIRIRIDSELGFQFILESLRLNFAFLPCLNPTNAFVHISSDFHRRKHRIGIVWKMTAYLVESASREVRRSHSHITGGKFRFSRELFEFVDDSGAAGEPEGETGADVVVKGEEFKFLSQL